MGTNRGADPYTAIHLDCLGSNLNSYCQSIDKVRDSRSDTCH
jgi:hypothetical protein